MTSTSKKTSKQSDPPATTTITMVVDEEKEKSADQLPDWIADVKGLVYLDEYDGYQEPDVVKIEPPKCTIDETVQPIYQCIKCGNKQTTLDKEIHRMKCTRCYNKAFNKIRPTKWVKFRAY